MKRSLYPAAAAHRLARLTAFDRAIFASYYAAEQKPDINTYYLDLYNMR